MSHNDLSVPNEGLAAETRDLYFSAITDSNAAIPDEIHGIIERLTPLSETDLHTLAL